MSLESGTFVSDLQQTNPPGTDKKKQGDDHLRLIKTVLRNTFPNGSRAQYFARSRAVSTNGAIAATDMAATIAADATAGNISLSLPTLAAGDDGFVVTVVKADGTANTVTMTGTVNGISGFTLTRQFEAGMFVWGGAAWFGVRFRPFIVTGDIQDSAITNAKLRNSANLSVIGNPANSVAAPQDIAATVDNQVLMRSGGALAWALLGAGNISDNSITAAKLTVDAKPFISQYLHVRDEVASGTASQGALTTSTWNTRRLQTKKTDDLSITLSGNQITLLAGTYYCRAHSIVSPTPDMGAGGACTGSAQLRLRNVTDSATLLTGDSWSWNGDAGNSWSMTINQRLEMEGRFTLSGTKAIELQNWVKNVVNCAFAAGDAISSGENEAYSTVEIWKIG